MTSAPPLLADVGGTAQVTQPRLRRPSIVAVVHGWWRGADDTDAAAAMVVVWHPLRPRRWCDEVADATPSSTVTYLL
jgi:hypothetical protein